MVLNVSDNDRNSLAAAMFAVAHQELTVDLGAMRRRPNWIRPQTERNWRMCSAGYKEEDIKGIMGRNWRRFLERALPA